MKHVHTLRSDDPGYQEETKQLDKAIISELVAGLGQRNVAPRKRRPGRPESPTGCSIHGEFKVLHYNGHHDAWRCRSCMREAQARRRKYSNGSPTMKFRVTFATVTTYDVEVECESASKAEAIARMNAEPDPAFNASFRAYDPEVILVEQVDG